MNWHSSPVNICVLDRKWQSSPVEINVNHVDKNWHNSPPQQPSGGMRVRNWHSRDMFAR